MKLLNKIYCWLHGHDLFVIVNYDTGTLIKDGQCLRCDKIIKILLDR